MQIQIIPRQEAIAYLHRRKHPRGVGSNVDLINYGLVNDKNKIVAVARIGVVPYGQSVAAAAVGDAQAAYTAYLMRQFAAGISSQELVEFVQGYTARLHEDMGARRRDIRYLLSLDDPNAWLIEGRVGPIAVHRGVTGRVYINTGALEAGQTKTPRKPSRWIDDAGQVHSLYNSGKHILNDLPAGARLIHEGTKHRFVWVLAPRGSVLYHAWRSRLPQWVHNPDWGGYGLGWTQPRLLYGGGRLVVAIN